MKKDNLLADMTLEQVQAINWVLESFYYGKDLKHKCNRLFYKNVLKTLKTDVKDYLNDKTLKPRQ